MEWQRATIGPAGRERKGVNPSDDGRLFDPDHPPITKPALAAAAARPRSRVSATERSLQARAAAYRMHSLHDGRQVTANARRAFNDRFAHQVDPENVLSEAERSRRAESARKAYFSSLAARSVRARREGSARPPAPKARAGRRARADGGTRPPSPQP